MFCARYGKSTSEGVGEYRDGVASRHIFGWQSDLHTDERNLDACTCPDTCDQLVPYPLACAISYLESIEHAGADCKDCGPKEEPRIVVSCLGNGSANEDRGNSVTDKIRYCSNARTLRACPLYSLEIEREVVDMRVEC